MTNMQSTGIVKFGSGFSLVLAALSLPGFLQGASAGEPTHAQRRAVNSPLRLAETPANGLTARLTLDMEAYGEIKSATDVVLTDFALSRGRAVDLELRRVEVFAENASFVAGTASGDMPLPRPDVVLLSGQVVGHADSLAFLGLSPHGTNGLIELDGKTYVVSGARGVPKGNSVIYNLTDLPPGAIKWADFKCAVDETVFNRGAQAFPIAVPVTGVPGDGIVKAVRMPMWTVDIAIETDWEFTAAVFGGNMDAAGAYAASLIAAISEIYVRDLSTHLQISYLRLWPDSNDPWNAPDPLAQLEQFAGHWQSNMGEVDRHTAHFISGRSLGGGWSYRGVLCSDVLGYGVSSGMQGYFPYPLQDNHNDNWDIFIVAHELGHNFGAPHTHNLIPPIDNCGLGDCSAAPNGTLMSLCNGCPGGMANISLRFHDRMIDEVILPYLDGLTCIIAWGPPTILKHPSDAGVCDGHSATLSVIASGETPLAFEWRKDGEIVPGATLKALTFDPVTEADVGVYEVTVTNVLGSAVSDPATLSVLECGPPEIIKAGCRHLAIVSQAGLTVPVAFLVSSPDHPCLSNYVDVDGTLVTEAVFQAADLWGTTYVGGSELIPSSDYEVRVDYGSPGDPNLSVPTLVVLPPWGDVVGGWTGVGWLPADGVVDFTDISAQVDPFKNLSTAPPFSWCDIYPAEPDGIISFNEISSTVDGFRGRPYPFAGPCL